MAIVPQFGVFRVMVAELGKGKVNGLVLGAMK
jgi:hypothetical protein